MLPYIQLSISGQLGWCVVLCEQPGFDEGDGGEVKPGRGEEEGEVGPREGDEAEAGHHGCWPMVRAGVTCAPRFPFMGDGHEAPPRLWRRTSLRFQGHDGELAFGEALETR